MELSGHDNRCRNRDRQKGECIICSRERPGKRKVLENAHEESFGRRLAGGWWLLLLLFIFSPLLYFSPRFRLLLGDAILLIISHFGQASLCEIFNKEPTEQGGGQRDTDI